MLNKLFWSLIVILILYLVIIVKAPTVATQIDNLLKIDWFSQKVIEFKKTFDEIVTKIPTKDELKIVYSWAVLKVEQTKEAIDTVREKAWELENKYDEAVDFIDETKQKAEDLKENFQEISDLVSSWTQLINSWTNLIGTWEIEAK